MAPCLLRSARRSASLYPTVDGDDAPSDTQDHQTENRVLNDRLLRNGQDPLAEVDSKQTDQAEAQKTHRAKNRIEPAARILEGGSSGNERSEGEGRGHDGGNRDSPSGILAHLLLDVLNPALRHEPAETLFPAL